ncbi:MAG: hypothetical protein HY332_03180 [Chloroflexi bacterium]|nr:hypothetical protein [Chloroflexota bacterium]
MAGSAARSVPVGGQSHALGTHRPALGAPQLVLLFAAGVALLVSAAALVAPPGSVALRHALATWSAASPAGARAASGATDATSEASASTAIPPRLPLSRADAETVLSYARTLRPDDSLVEVRRGVFAKRSNVQGIPIGGHTVYYDIVPHQSYGPLRTGTWTERDVRILRQESTGNGLVLIYVPK